MFVQTTVGFILSPLDDISWKKCSRNWMGKFLILQKFLIILFFSSPLKFSFFWGYFVLQFARVGTSVELMFIILYHIHCYLVFKHWVYIRIQKILMVQLHKKWVWSLSTLVASMQVIVWLHKCVLILLIMVLFWSKTIIRRLTMNTLREKSSHTNMFQFHYMSVKKSLV